MTSGQRRRVLIAEDEPDALDTLQSWIKDQGLQVRGAQSGQAALDLTRSFKPDILITDYLLQDDWSGVDLIVQLRAAGMKVRCVLLTGVLQNALLESVHQLHGVPILTKPCDLNRLRELIWS